MAQDRSVDPGVVAEMSRRSGSLLRAMAAARAEEGLAAEDLLIYLAIGHLGVDGSGPTPRLTPRTYLDIAAFLNVPRETVRRKVVRLADRGFTQIGPRGVVVRDVAEWLRHVEALVATDRVAAADPPPRPGPATARPARAPV